MTHRSPLPAAALAGLLMVANALPPAGLAQTQPSEERLYQQRLRQLFDQLDRNGDGRLNRREASLNAYLERHFERLDRGGKGYLLPSDLR
jgi:Ca2+-binding EF-hand superfamily protein